MMRTLMATAIFCMSAMLHAAESNPSSGEPAAAKQAGAAMPSRLRDEKDGWFDISDFLDTAYGFVPIIAPITEPAVGYGASGALVFVDRQPHDERRGYTRPNIAAIGGMATENGSRGMFGLHLGTWLNDRLRTIAAIGDLDINLDYYGLGGDRPPEGSSVGYSVQSRAGVIGGNLRLGESAIWAGLRYILATNEVELGAPDLGLPGLAPREPTLRLAAITPSLTFDSRDNFFTPTRGWYVDISAQLFRKDFGGDRDFDKTTVMITGHHPLGNQLFLSARGSAKTSTDDTPFYLRPYVWLRGVEAMRYQGREAAEVEAELRWEFHHRFSAVGFAGAGVARGGNSTPDRAQDVATAGAGIRYRVARKHGLHMGLDVAAGPDKPIFYVVFGSAWIRP